MAVDDAYSKLLLHFEGADASTTITDEAGHTVTANGNAQIDTAQKKFQTASCLFDGTGDYLSSNHSTDYNFGTGNFTVDFWIRWNDKTGEQFLIDKSVDGNDRWIMYKTTDDKISFSATISSSVKANYITTSALTIANNTWYHLALVRNGTAMLLFLDGVSQTLTENTAVSTNNFGDNTGNLFIGMYRDGSTDPLNGWIDEFRYSVGIARWTANFDVPTWPYGVAREGGAFLLNLI